MDKIEEFGLTVFDRFIRQIDYEDSMKTFNEQMFC